MKPIELKLRPYQSRITNATLEALYKENKKGSRHVGLYACCGGGKSVISAFMARNSAEKGNRVLILTHRVEILKQNFSKMDLLDLDIALLYVATTTIPSASIVCAMIQTLRARLDNPMRRDTYKEFMSTFDFIIIDEAHRSEADNLFQYFRPDAWVVGMSGSWLRSGSQKQLGDLYSTIVSPVMPEELIELGNILPSENFIFKGPRLDDVAVDYSSGDYNQKQLTKRFQKPERYAGIISNYQRICPGKSMIVFTTSARHAIDLTIEFCKSGIKAKYLLSEKFPDTDKLYSGKREDVINDVRGGQIQILISVEMASTGLDIPEIDGVILDFSTKSYTKYLQCLGRGCRPFSNQSFFYVLDFGGNVDRFGRFESDPIMSLFHKTGEGGVPPTKMCPTDRKDPEGKCGCGRLLPVSLLRCPFPGCGFIFLTDKQEYEVELTRMVDGVDESNMSIKEWAAKKKLEGWSVTRILASVMIKNKTSMRKAFNEAIPVLRTEKGEMISPSYYYFMKKYIIDKRVKK